MPQADFNFAPTDEILATFFKNFDYKNLATAEDPFLNRLFVNGYNENHKWVTIKFADAHMFAFVIEIGMFENPVTENGHMYSIEEDTFKMLTVYFSTIHFFFGKGSLYCDEMVQFIRKYDITNFLMILYEELRERYGSDDDFINFSEVGFD